jgi:Fe2+ or Zn2+ uptake regulation protein
MLKKTKTREEILSLFESISTPLTANDIYEKLKNKNITLSSIYRTLETFTNQNILIKNIDPKGIAIYTLKQEKHTHYLECKNCHSKVELEY